MSAITMQEVQIKENKFLSFRERLDEKLKDPETRERFTVERHKLRLEAMVNDLLRETGNEKYCVEIMDIDEL